MDDYARHAIYIGIGVILYFALAGLVTIGLIKIGEIVLK